MKLLSLTAILPGEALFSAVMSVAPQTRAAAMRTVIDRLLLAFQDGHPARALAYVTPSVRKKLGSSAMLLGLIETGFPMLLDIQRVIYLPSQVDKVPARQRVMIRDSVGMTHVLEFDLAKTAEGWRVEGLRTLPLMLLERG